MNRQLFLGLVLVVTPLSSAVADVWRDAESKIQRLAPAAFKELPIDFVSELERRGCTIPQPHREAVYALPRNVLSGQFAAKGQQDWAVLCSRKGTSAILIFWGGPNTCPTPINEEKDELFLQGLTTEIGYSRGISAVTRTRGPEPVVLEHHAVEDAFLGKHSGISYCDKGEWKSLVGGD